MSGLKMKGYRKVPGHFEDERGGLVPSVYTSACKPLEVIVLSDSYKSIFF